MIIGIDEAGRGPLAGPVVAAAIILTKQPQEFKLTDSKLLSEKKREIIFRWILANCYWSIASSSAEEVDKINIRQASLLAMFRAWKNLNIQSTEIIIDGLDVPDGLDAKAMIKADLYVPEVSAASIVAKVFRDKLMKSYSTLYPEYRFDQHKGYPTSVHKTMIAKYGPCPIHRRSFNWKKQ